MSIHICIYMHTERDRETYKAERETERETERVREIEGGNVTNDLKTLSIFWCLLQVSMDPEYHDP